MSLSVVDQRVYLLAAPNDVSYGLVQNQVDALALGSYTPNSFGEFGKNSIIFDRWRLVLPQALLDLQVCLQHIMSASLSTYALIELI